MSAAAANFEAEFKRLQAQAVARVADVHEQLLKDLQGLKRDALSELEHDAKK